MVKTLLLPLIALLVVAACSSATVEPTLAPSTPAVATPSVLPTATASPTPAPTAVPTATAAASRASTTSPSLMPSPTASLTPVPATAPPTAPPATPSAVPTTTTEPPAGGGQLVIRTAGAEVDLYLVNPDGYTLYVYANDAAGVSNCTGECAQAWPPLTVQPGTEIVADGFEDAFSTLTRDDGSLQVAYDDQPLYTYQGDTKPGQTNGEGIAGFWDLARPAIPRP